MGKTRRFIVIVMLLVFFVGCILFAYPYIRGFYLDYRVQEAEPRPQNPWASVVQVEVAEV